MSAATTDAPRTGPAAPSVSAISDDLSATVGALIARLRDSARRDHELALQLEYAGMKAIREAEALRAAALESRRSYQRVAESASKACELLAEDAAAALAAAEESLVSLGGDAPAEAAPLTPDEEADAISDPCEPRPAGAPAADPMANDKGAFDPAWVETAETVRPAEEAAVRELLAARRSPAPDHALANPCHADATPAHDTADAEEASAAAGVEADVGQVMARRYAAIAAATDAEEVSAAGSHAVPNKQQDAAERLLGVPAAAVSGPPAGRKRRNR